eukprot:gene18110-biopygen857
MGSRHMPVPRSTQADTPVSGETHPIRVQERVSIHHASLVRADDRFPVLASRPRGGCCGGGCCSCCRGAAVQLRRPRSRSVDPGRRERWEGGGAARTSGPSLP